MGAVVFVRGRSSSYVRGRFRTCVVGFEQMQVSGVMGVEDRGSGGVVIVDASWLGRSQRGWGRCSCGHGGRGGRGHHGCGGLCRRPHLSLLLVGYGRSLSVV